VLPDPDAGFGAFYPEDPECFFPDPKNTGNAPFQDEFFVLKI
jgi:hypothetical protein